MSHLLILSFLRHEPECRIHSIMSYHPIFQICDTRCCRRMYEPFRDCPWPTVHSKRCCDSLMQYIQALLVNLNLLASCFDTAILHIPSKLLLAFICQQYYSTHKVVPVAKHALVLLILTHIASPANAAYSPLLPFRDCCNYYHFLFLIIHRIEVFSI